MNAMTEGIRAALAHYIDPNTNKDFASTRSVKKVQVDGDRVTLEIALGYPTKDRADAIAQQVRLYLNERFSGLSEIMLTIDTQIMPHVVQRGLKPKPGVRNVIAVASGKGGVGKSTVAVNLAAALASAGARVGLLDADIYGPSQPTMTGASGKPETTDGKTMEPLVSHGMQVSSIGFLVDANDAMIWRGPMVTQALVQLFAQTNWQDLDYLIVDMPPGTGDIQLTLAQKIPVTAAVIVTTPQDIALMDARRGLRMFEKVDIPNIGIIENMGIHICSNCGHEESIFGTGGGASLSRQFDVELLGSLPLSMAIRESADKGKPIMFEQPDGRIARLYADIARKVAARVAALPRDMISKIPNIVVKSD